MASLVLSVFLSIWSPFKFDAGWDEGDELWACWSLRSEPTSGWWEKELAEGDQGVDQPLD